MWLNSWAIDLLASNVNHLRWNTGWVKRTRYGNPDGPATILSNTSPATLTTGKTYYWQIVTFGANGGMSKSLEGRFTVASAISSSSNVSSSKSSFSSSRSSSSSSAPTAQTTTTTYAYDDLGRVKTVTHPNAVKNTYTYDAADNRTKKESTAN